MTEMMQRAQGQEAGLAAREQSEMQASVILAMRFPRDERDAYAALAAACQRPTFAEKARYVFPRGTQKITGPSVKFAREAARCWRNIRYGYRVVGVAGEFTTVEGYAFDMQTNTRAACEITFKMLIFRKGKTEGTGGWVVPDERDAAELVARHGAKMERNCILKVLPPDVVEDALEEVRRTVVRIAQNETKLDRSTVLRRIAAAFGEFSVSGEMLDAYLGHPLETVTVEEIADLHAVLTSLRDGNTRADEVFNMRAPTKNQAAASSLNPLNPLDALAAILRGAADEMTSGPHEPPSDAPGADARAESMKAALAASEAAEAAATEPTDAEFQEALAAEEAAAAGNALPPTDERGRRRK